MNLSRHLVPRQKRSFTKPRSGTRRLVSYLRGDSFRQLKTLYL